MIAPTQNRKEIEIVPQWTVYVINTPFKGVSNARLYCNCTDTLDKTLKEHITPKTYRYANKSKAATNCSYRLGRNSSVRTFKEATLLYTIKVRNKAEAELIVNQFSSLKVSHKLDVIAGRWNGFTACFRDLKERGEKLYGI